MPPFVGDNYVEVLTRKTTERAPRLEMLREGVPDHLVALCHACLEIDPDRRPPTVMAVLAMLDPPVTSTALVPIDAAARTRVDRIAVNRAHAIDEPAPRRVPWIVVGAAVLFVALGIGAWRITAATQDGEPPKGSTNDAKVEDKLATAEPAPEPTPPMKQDVPPVDPPPVDPPSVDPVPKPMAQPVADPPIDPPVDPSADPPAEPPVDPAPAELAPTKASPKGTSPVDTPTCKQHRAAGQSAKNKRDWSAVLANAGNKSCWGGSYRAEAVSMKVNALFNLERFAECAKAGKKATGADAKIAKNCAERSKGG